MTETNTPLLPAINEARQAVDEAQARLERIRGRAAELSIRANAITSQLTQHDRHLAVALVDGDAGQVERLQAEPQRLAGIVTTMSPQEAKRALLALRSLEAEAQAELADARSTLRRCVMRELDDELRVQAKAYDGLAVELQAAWLRTTVLLEVMAGMTGRSDVPLTWHKLLVPMALPKSVSGLMARFDHPSSGELMSGPGYNGARRAVLEAMAQRGVQPADVGR